MQVTTRERYRTDRASHLVLTIGLALGALLLLLPMPSPASAGRGKGKAWRFSTTTTTSTDASTSTTAGPTTTSTTTTSTTTSSTTTTSTTTPSTTTTTAVAPANPSPSPSGQAMPVGDLPGWRQVFVDDFTTNVPLGSFPNAVSTRWGAYLNGWHDTSGHGTYMPSKVLSVQNGMLDFWVHTENGVHLVSVPYPKIPGATSENGMLYGRYAVRFRSDPLPGYKTAWLLWPDSGTWPRDGEIDFPEGDLDGTSTISGFVHHQGATSGSDQDAFGTRTTFTAWHTAVIEWSPGLVRFILDGTVIGTSTSRVPNTPMHWVLQTETSLDGSTPADSVAGHVQVDWVAVYRPA